MSVDEDIEAVDEEAAGVASEASADGAGEGVADAAAEAAIGADALDAGAPRRIDFAAPGPDAAADALVRSAAARLASALVGQMGSGLRCKVRVEGDEPVRRSRSDIAATLAPSVLCRPIELSAPAGHGWLLVERALVFALADLRYGGKGAPRDDDRPPSTSELRLSDALCQALCRALEGAWRPVTPLVAHVAASGSPDVERERFMTGGADDALYECALRVDAGAGSAGCSVLLAHPAVRTLAPRPSASAVQRLGHAAAFGDELAASVGTCEVELVGVLAEQGITLGELAGLRPGDFIALDERRAVRFRTGGRTVFDARVGMNDGRVAASVTRLHLPRD